MGHRGEQHQWCRCGWSVVMWTLNRQMWGWCWQGREGGTASGGLLSYGSYSSSRCSKSSWLQQSERQVHTLVQPNSGNRLCTGCLTGSSVCLKVGRFTTLNVMETSTEANFPTGIDSFDLSQVGLAD